MKLIGSNKNGLKVLEVRISSKSKNEAEVLISQMKQTEFGKDLVYAIH